MQTQSDSILRETIVMIGTILGSELDAITIERAVIGLFFYWCEAQQRRRRYQRHTDQVDP